MITLYNIYCIQSMILYTFHSTVISVQLYTVYRLTSRRHFAVILRESRGRHENSIFPLSGFANEHNPAHAARILSPEWSLEHSISFTIVPSASFRCSTRMTSSSVGEVSRRGDFFAGRPEVVCQAETPPESSSRDSPGPTASFSRQNLEIAKEELG